MNYNFPFLEPYQNEKLNMVLISNKKYETDNILKEQNHFISPTINHSYDGRNLNQNKNDKKTALNEMDINLNQNIKTDSKKSNLNQINENIMGPPETSKFVSKEFNKNKENKKGVQRCNNNIFNVIKDQDKLDKKENKNLDKNNNINKFKVINNLEIIKITKENINKNNNEIINSLKTNFFDFFMNAYEQLEKEKDYDEAIQNFTNTLNDLKWIDLLKNYSMDFSISNLEENKEILFLLEKTPLLYIEEILSKIVSFENDNQYDFHVKKVRDIFKTIKCLINAEKRSANKNDKKILNQEEFDEINIKRIDNIEEPLENLSAISFNFHQNDKNNIFKISNTYKEQSTNFKTTQTNTQKYNEIKKNNRKDNLSNRLKTMILYGFAREFNQNNFGFKFPKKPKSESNANINEETNSGFFQTNFENFYYENNPQIKGNNTNNSHNKNEENFNLLEEANKLLKMTKLEFLRFIMNDNIKRENFFEMDKNEQIEKYQNLKCRNLALNLFKTKNFDGLILLINFIIIDQKLYWRINNAKLFENTIRTLNGFEDFNLMLTINEMKEIDERINKLKEIAWKKIS